MTYDYRLDRCNVEDKESLREFRRVRKEWISWLHGPIRTNIITMMTDNALFRTINEARRLSSEQPIKSVLINVAVSNLIDRGFATSQLMAIRRLVSGRRNDISLERLLYRIRQKRSLITRENFVAYDGLPYDYEEVRIREMKSIAANSPGDVTSNRLSSKGPKAWAPSQRLHEKFDQLSGKTPEQRNRGDLIRNSLFADLFERIRACAAMKQAASQSIAHISRELQPNANALRISLRSIRSAQKTICEIATIIDGPLLWESSPSFVAIPQYDFLEGFDKAWTAKRNLPRLREIWDEADGEVEKWTNFRWPEKCS